MHFFELESKDFDEIAQHLQAFDAQFRQIQGGQFHGKLKRLHFGPVVCMKLQFSHAILAKGILRKPSFVFSPVTTGNQAARWRGHSLALQQINVLGSQEIMDHVTTDNYTTTSLIIDSHRIKELTADRLGYDVEEALHRHVVIRPGAMIYQQILELGESAVQAAGQGGIIDEEKFLERLNQLLINTFVAIDPRLESRAPYKTRQQVIRRSNELIQNNLHRIVSMAELCRAAECSERTLQYAFKERYGISPKEYMLIQRLNAVRGLIKRERPHPKELSGLTKSWGFSHHGEFAARYRHLFGELPSMHAGLFRHRSS